MPFACILNLGAKLTKDQNREITKTFVFHFNFTFTFTFC